MNTPSTAPSEGALEHVEVQYMQLFTKLHNEHTVHQAQ